MEAALVLPILLIIVFALMDISFYFWTSSLATKAVQLGARRAIVSASVAVGPGLDVGESEAYWDGLAPGLSCFPASGGRSPCPVFAVQCDLADGCRCSGGACRFRFEATRLQPILAAMRAVMPDLQLGNVQISYTTNDLGYVTRPVPVPVDVRVSLVGVTYRPLIFGGLLGSSLPLRASASLPGESLGVR